MSDVDLMKESIKLLQGRSKVSQRLIIELLKIDLELNDGKICNELEIIVKTIRQFTSKE
jgi:hypothetical protein